MLYALHVHLFVLFSVWCDSPHWGRASFTRFLGHTQRRITVGRTPLDEGSARRRDLYLTTHNTHNRQTSMFQVGFERPQTRTLDHAAIGNLVGLVKESNNIQVHAESNFINVCHPKKNPNGLPLHRKHIKWIFSCRTAHFCYM